MEKIYGIDQQILDERGIGLTVSQVVNLSSSEYSARLRRLCLPPRDETFVKRLRRRIKNRMASQNSRRRTAEHIKALRVELRSVRARKQHALEERRELLRQRETLVDRCRSLSKYLRQKLSERQDLTPLPVELDVRLTDELTHKLTEPSCKLTEPTRKLMGPTQCFETRLENLVVRRIEEMYRCDKEKSPPNDSVLDFTTIKLKDLKRVKDTDLKPKIKIEANEKHNISIKDNILNEKEEVAKIFSNLKMKTEYNKVLDQEVSPGELPKIIRAKCVPVELASNNIDKTPKNNLVEKFIFKDDSIDHPKDQIPKKMAKKKSCIVHTSDVEYENFYDTLLSKTSYFSNGGESQHDEGVLNLCVKPVPGEARRKHHGRKQPAPRRITHLHQACHEEDGALDLKVRGGDWGGEQC